jgi:uncharacterized membrane protein YpjA
MRNNLSYRKESNYQKLFYNHSMLTILILFNLIGTVWGFIWYGPQLAITPWYLMLFVPDCPLQALIFAIFLTLYPFRSQREATASEDFLVWLAVLGSIKYGLWTQIILGQAIMADSYSTDTLILFASHFGMTLEGLIYFPRGQRRFRPILAVALWFAANDGFDYFLDTHPVLPLYNQEGMAFFTAVVLSLATVVTAFGLCRYWQTSLKRSLYAGSR